MNETMDAMETTFGLNIEQIRDEFPMLKKRINGKQLIYLDSAATGHKPKRMLDCLYRFYAEEYGKPKESHTLGKNATAAVEEARGKIAKFIGAAEPKEVIFSRGCTESLNIVAGGFGKGLLQPGDEILISALEHHANIVPWQMACQISGAQLKVVPITPAGELDMDAYAKMLSPKVKIVSMLHSSHVLGTVLPIKEIVAKAHALDIPVLVDGAQYAPHAPVNMQDLDCDFYTFSGHKMGSPSGIGVLYGKVAWLEKLPPFEGGHDMTKEVTFEHSTYKEIPDKFQAGTMPFAEIIAFGTVIDYVNELDIHRTSQYEQELLHYATEKLSNIEGLKIAGTAPEKEPVLSFSLKGMDVKKLETFLNDQYNIEVRAGDLSAQPLMKLLDVPALLRVSFCYYNTPEEIDVLTDAIAAFIKKNRK